MGPIRIILTTLFSLGLICTLLAPSGSSFGSANSAKILHKPDPSTKPDPHDMSAVPEATTSKKFPKDSKSESRPFTKILHFRASFVQLLQAFSPDAPAKPDLTTKPDPPDTSTSKSESRPFTETLDKYVTILGALRELKRLLKSLDPSSWTAILCKTLHIMGTWASVFGLVAAVVAKLVPGSYREAQIANIIYEKALVIGLSVAVIVNFALLIWE